MAGIHVLTLRRESTRGALCAELITPSHPLGYSRLIPHILDIPHRSGR